MNVLNGNLEAVEGTGLGDLDLLHEASGEIFQNNAVGGSEEGEDVFDEMLLVGGEGSPMAEVLR